MAVDERSALTGRPKTANIVAKSTTVRAKFIRGPEAMARARWPTDLTL